MVQTTARLGKVSALMIELTDGEKAKEEILGDG
jgi:hypothetical protein